jgi:hypothetical protein
MNVAPCGSAMTLMRTHGASNGGAISVPPSSVALAATASASSTPKVTLQCGWTSRWSGPIGLRLATTSSKPGGPPELGHALAQAGVALLEVVAVAGQRPGLLAAVQRQDLPAEDRAVEGLGAVHVARREVVEVERAVLVDDPRARGAPSAARRRTSRPRDRRTRPSGLSP